MPTMTSVRLDLDPLRAFKRAVRVLARAAAVSLGAFVSCAAAMQPGLWELTITVNVEGKPQSVPAARQCLAQADIDHATKTLPRPDGVCELSNVERTPKRATYDLACQQDSVTTLGRAEIVFAENRYDGKVDLVISGKSGGGIPVAMTINAARVGDCPN